MLTWAGDGVNSLVSWRTLRVELSGADAGDRFSVTEALAFQTTEPPLHIHHNEDEAWYILEGHMTFHTADQVLEAPAGAFVFGPRGVPHTFTVDAEPTRVLVFASPAGLSDSRWTWATLVRGHPSRRVVHACPRGSRPRRKALRDRGDTPARQSPSVGSKRILEADRHRRPRRCWLSWPEERPRT